MLGKIEGKRRRGRRDEMASLTCGHEFEQTPGDGGILQFVGSQRVRHDLAAEQQQQPKKNSKKSVINVESSIQAYQSLSSKEKLRMKEIAQ